MKLLIFGLFIFVLSFPVDELKQQITGPVYVETDSDYSENVKVDNKYYQINPKAVCLPKTVQDIQNILRFVKKYNLKFAVKTGGHSACGYSLNTDLVISMKNFKQYALNGDELTLGAGYTWREVYQKVPLTQVPVGGACPGVGVSGFLLGGGYSFLSRSFGLGSDQIIEYEMVKPNGDFVKVNKDQEKDLFWALGAGGGNFGIVTQFKLKTHRIPLESLNGDLCYDLKRDDLPEIIRYYNGEYMNNSPNQITTYGMIKRINGTDYFCLTIIHTGEYEAGVNLIRGFLARKPELNLMQKRNFIRFVLANNSTALGSKYAYIKSAMVYKGNMNEKLFEIMRKYHNNRPSMYPLILWMNGAGKVAEKRPHETSFYHRDAYYIIEAKSLWLDPKDEAKHIEWLDNFFKEIEPYTNGAYLNYIDKRLDNWREKYYGSNWERLLQIKQRVDPDNLFHFQQSIHRPAMTKNEREKIIIQKMEQFQLGQTRLSVEILEPLFANDIITRIPLGTGFTQGKDKVLESFKQFFTTVAVMRQQRTGPFEINEGYGGYPKQIHQTTKKGCNVKYSVMNWFNFDENFKIKEFTALFNLTSVIEQNSKC